MRLDKDKIKNDLDITDIHKILKDLGSNAPKEDRLGNPMYSTICHSGNSHKLYYYHETKQFHCYTECSETFDIYELVVKVKREQGYTYSFPQAIQYVAGLTGKFYSLGFQLDKNTERISDWDWINRLKRKEKLSIDLPTYDERVLDVFLPYPHISWIDEGISYKTINKFEIGYYFREEKISIPHRSIMGDLVGVRGRAMLQEDIDNGRKYMPLTIGNKLYNHPTMGNLYGLHKTKEAIRRIKKAAIFEGEKSVLKCEDYYGENNFSVACCSSSITNFQRDLLLSLDIEEVIICFDKFRGQKVDETDEKYEKAIEDYQDRLLQFARKFTPYVRVGIVWDDHNLLDYKMSPVDKGKEILEQLMKNKYEINTSGVEM